MRETSTRFNRRLGGSTVQVLMVVATVIGTLSLFALAVNQDRILGMFTGDRSVEARLAKLERVQDSFVPGHRSTRNHPPAQVQRQARPHTQPQVTASEQFVDTDHWWASVITDVARQMRLAAPGREDNSLPRRSYSPRDTDHWAFQSLQPPPISDMTGDQWSGNPIDRFVLAEQQKQGLAPNQVADRRTLARRLSFGLLGLPPTAADVAAFASAEQPWAYEELVDRWLSDPAFGERWARVWLDLARYADTNGYEEDEFRPNAYTYRDFVIWAMNDDLPFDEFIRWQIAGDELRPQNQLAQAATGFMTAAPHNTFFPQPKERLDEIDNMISTLGTSMLGLTLGCARCHDHKYDDIPIDEYYQLVAILQSTRRSNPYLVPDGGQAYLEWYTPLSALEDERRDLLRTAIRDERIRELVGFTEAEKQLLRQPDNPADPVQQKLLNRAGRRLDVTDDEIYPDAQPLPRDRSRYSDLGREITEYRTSLRVAPPRGLTLAGSDVTTTSILRGGELDGADGEVGPGFLSLLSCEDVSWPQDSWRRWAEDAQNPTPRAALANWMTDVDQGAGPLLARVIVNRLWQHHFGQGLMTSPDDFGRQSDPPLQKGLLDWLAYELVEHQWSLKHLHRLIVTSQTYRQSCVPGPEKQRVDPGNRLLARRVPRRLTAEMIRDAMLFTGGNLNRQMYGKGVFVSIPREAILNREQDVDSTWPASVPDEFGVWRRAVYVVHRRTFPVPFFQLFDQPDSGNACGQRKNTTVPTQSLAIWNAPFVRRQAAKIADRILDSVSSHGAASSDTQSNGQAELVVATEALFSLAFQRAPTVQETEWATALLIEGGALSSPEARRAELTNLCQAVLMSNEYLFID